MRQVALNGAVLVLSLAGAFYTWQHRDDEPSDDTKVAMYQAAKGEENLRSGSRTRHIGDSQPTRRTRSGTRTSLAAASGSASASRGRWRWNRN